VPFEEITKGSELRQLGKISELALGYGGSVGALSQMGGERMGLTQGKMKSLVNLWREKNKAIVAMWQHFDSRAKEAIRYKKKVTSKNRGVTFESDGDNLMVGLPSGRKLFYKEPQFTTNKFGSESIKYRGMDQQTKQWGWVETYGGKISENIVQAIARDILAEAMLKLDDRGFNIVMHVHDEAGCEVDSFTAGQDLERMCRIMEIMPDWARSLPLTVDGYITSYYKKD